MLEKNRLRAVRGILLVLFFRLFLLFFFFFPFSPSIDRRWSKSIADNRFWQYCPVAGGPRTGNLADRYVPPDTGGTNRYGKPSLQFRSVPPDTGGTYRSSKLPVHELPATGRYRQKSIVGGRLREKLTVGGRLREKKERRRRGKEEKRTRGEKGKKEIPSVILAHGSPAHCHRPRAIAALACFFSHTRRPNVAGAPRATRAPLLVRTGYSFSPMLP
ncbi:hypothetical protein BHE74_00043060 [Ensete ventricosum]|nr:hypothetical protein BHE74_00043060 [Ensete ventricosum]